MPLVSTGDSGTIRREPDLTVDQTERAVRLARRMYHEFKEQKRKDGRANGSTFGMPIGPNSPDDLLKFAGVMVELLDEESHQADICRFCKFSYTPGDDCIGREKGPCES